MGAALFVGGQGLTSQCRGTLWSGCAACTEIDTSGAEWLFCIDDSRQHSLPSKAKNTRRRRAKDTNDEPWREVNVQQLEELTKQLFELHDLNGDDMLEESELITLNVQIAILHHGKDTDIAEIRAKYAELFRTKLDPRGQPVPYEVFRQYAAEVLDGLDNDPEAQEMILEQFVAEARSGRQAFDLHLTDFLELGPERTGRSDASHGPGPAAEVHEGRNPPEPSAAVEPPAMVLPLAPVFRDEVIVASEAGANLQEEMESSQCSPTSGRTDDMAEDLTGCSTATASSPRLAGPAESSAEEGGSWAEVGAGGGPTLGDAVEDRGSGACPKDTAACDTPPVPRLATESSLGDDTPLREGDGGAPGSLVVEQRSVRRASSCPPKEPEPGAEDRLEAADKNATGCRGRPL